MRNLWMICGLNSVRLVQIDRFESYFNPFLSEKGTTMTDKSRSDINTLNKRMYNVQEKYSQYGLMVPEERRNLCEGESNLAECIKEVEDAKSTPATSILQTGEVPR